MQFDPWRQWQAFAAQATPTGLASQATAARDGGFGITHFIEAAQRFTTAARSFLEGTANASAPAATEAARIFSDFLRDQFANFSQLPWNTKFGGAAHGAPAFMADAPALGLTREHQQRWQRMAEAWRRLEDAQHRLQRLWSDALRDAAVAFAARRRPPPPTVPSAEALHSLYDTWIDCAEEAYAHTAHSDAFCDALGEFVNASSHWRRELQASIEQSAKLLDLPTRSEINTLSQRLRSVEEQLHALRTARKPQVAPRTARKPQVAPRAERKPQVAPRTERKPRAVASKGRRNRRKSKP